MIRNPQTRCHKSTVAILLRTALYALLPILYCLLPPCLLNAEDPGEHRTGAAVASIGTISLTEYQAKLQSLDRTVATCQIAMTPANCRADQVGADLQVDAPGATRQIRYAWLRALLEAAAKSQKEQGHTAREQADKKATGNAKEAAPAAPNRRPRYEPPTLYEQLQQARKRLAAEASSAAELASNSASSPSSSLSPASNSSTSAQRAAAPKAASLTTQRETLTRILAQKEFHPVRVGPTILEQIGEKIGNWIDEILGKLEQAGFRSKWVGRAAEIAFVLLVSIALVWFLIRLERQGRLSLSLIRPEPGSGAASARDWQLWLEDARKASTRGAWRDAIHLLYWASISRLESSGMWPADRARTPREYLALLTPQNSHHADLAALTRSFERTWYAGRRATAEDFRQTEALAAKLGIKPGIERGTQ